MEKIFEGEIVVDRDWIKNLATSRFQKDGWKFTNPEDVSALRAARETFAAEELLHAAEDYADVFNHFSSKKLSVLALFAKDDRSKVIGLLMLIGNIHMQFRIESKKLVQEMSEVQGFKTQTAKVGEFMLLTDPFGEVRWQSHAKSSLSHEDVIKKGLTELIKIVSIRS